MTTVVGFWFLNSDFWFLNSDNDNLCRQPRWFFVGSQEHFKESFQK